ncbi:hypothetical protein F5I97DRAFT_2006108 [Phlebopus sp. FC_14]|nr:hypothetical protein F5I97DRAFT_2006108 [Phlebopus sp. FC_14]
MVAATQAEKHLLWHPRWQNKFVVGGGSQMSMYQWDANQSEIRHLSSQSDLSFMKCFAWSPDPTFDDLFAVGLTTGRVDLIRLEATKATRNNVLSSGPVVSLPVRNSRSCHALAFCQVDPNYLAVGLDKVRGDHSLTIWDVQSCTSAWSTSKVGQDSDESKVARPQPRIARADIGPRTDARVLQQHAPTEVVSSLSFLPRSTHLLLAGVSARWLRLFDLRSAVPPTTNIASKVSGIATNPTDPHQIATCGDNVVTVWDVRRILHPLLTFTEKDAAADGARFRPGSVVHHIEFSSTRRGVLAAMEKDSTYVRFWDLQQAQGADGMVDGELFREPSQSRVARRSWAGLPWTATAYGAKQGPSEPQEPSAVVLANTLRTKHFSRALASFALVPNSRPLSLTSQVMVVNKDGDLELYAVHDAPKQVSWSSRGDLAIGAGHSYRLLPGFQDLSPPPQPWDIPTDHAQDDHVSRGARGDVGKAVPLVGRGDEDGISVSGGGSPAGSRHAKSRTYSPASFRNYPFELTPVRNDSLVHSEKPAQHPSREVSDQIQKPKIPRAQAEKSTSRVRRSSRVVSQVVEDDISMTMRHRVIRGYGLRSAAHNIDVCHDDPCSSNALSDLWTWICHSRENMCVPTSRIHGYDFSYQGVSGIWEGIPALPHPPENRSSVSSLGDLLSASSGGTAVDSIHPSRSSSIATFGPSSSYFQTMDDLSYGDFNAAIDALLLRQGPGKKLWSPTLRTNKLSQRQFALQLCGWYLNEDELSNAITKWEKDGQQARAACWLVFSRQYTKALELLMRSQDEMHHLLTGTLAALLPGSTASSELRDHSERLIVRLQDPYFRAMLTHLTSKDWSEVLEEEALPLRERLAIAFQFLEDRALSLYLRRTTEHACSRGDIEGLIITGLTSSGIDILQSYVDRTGDVQTAAILSSYVCPSKFPDTRAGRWLETYRDLLDGFKLFHHRVSFDIERGQILQEAMQGGDKWTQPPHILIRCNYCSKPMNPGFTDAVNKGRSTACPNCSRALPRCSVCLMTLSIVPDASRDTELLNDQSPYKDTIEDAIVLCQTCRHGGHASHIIDWFFGNEGACSHGVCPVADCDCRCGDEF